MTVTQHHSSALSELFAETAPIDRTVLIKRMHELDRGLCHHAKMVAAAVEAVIGTLDLASNLRNALIDAAWLHDLGKLTISRAILDKPGPLDAAEWDEIRQHPGRGAAYLGSAPGFELTIPMVRHHHERFDGAGYPDALSRDDIPFGARIIGIADAFDAMSTQRPYRPAMNQPEAIIELRRCAGSQFDSMLVEQFISVIPHLNREAIPCDPR